MRFSSKVFRAGRNGKSIVEKTALKEIGKTQKTSF